MIATMPRYGDYVRIALPSASFMLLQMPAITARYHYDNIDSALAPAFTLCYAMSDYAAQLRRYDFHITR